MKTKVMLTFTVAALLMTSPYADARPTVDLSASVAYLLTQAAADSGFDPNADALNGQAEVNTTFQDAPLFSRNRKYKLIGQSDGNLVIYKITPSGESAIWASNTNNGPGKYNFIFRDDGILWIFNSDKVIWASNSGGWGANKLVLRDDGNLIIYAPDGSGSNAGFNREVWWSGSGQSEDEPRPEDEPLPPPPVFNPPLPPSDMPGSENDTPCQPVSAPNAPSNTANFNRTFQDAPLTSCSGQYKLIGQSDGNLVIFKITPSGESPIWASNTNIGAGSYNFIFQSDGNLVIYSPNKPIWASNSGGLGGNRLVMQNDGNLVIYGPYGRVWASNSVQK